jgi:hypothetical protein
LFTCHWETKALFGVDNVLEGIGKKTEKKHCSEESNEKLEDIFFKIDNIYTDTDRN